MAYVTKELISKARQNIKERFSSKDGWKITCKRSPSLSCLVATIRKAPPRFHQELKTICKDGVVEVSCSLGKANVTENSYLKAIYGKLETCVMTDEYYNNSDVYTDYFDYSHYYDINVGEYDKPFVLATN